jgi:hypothetical protein
MHQKIEIIPTLKAGFITHDSNSSNLDNSNVDDEKKIPTSKPKSEKSSEKMKSKKISQKVKKSLQLLTQSAKDILMKNTN